MFKKKKKEKLFYDVHTEFYKTRKLSTCDFFELLLCIYYHEYLFSVSIRK